MKRLILAALGCAVLWCPRASAQVDTIYLQADQILPPAAATPAHDSTAKVSLIQKIERYFQQSNVDKTLQGKKFDITFIGGPHYSTAVGFGLGMVAAGMFRADRKDLTLPPSNVSLFADITTTGFFMLGIRGNTWFEGGKYRLDYKNYFMYQPGGFWGVGYDAGLNNPKSTYTRLEVDIKPDFMIRMARDFYLGASVEFRFDAGKKFTAPQYIPEGQGTRFIDPALGLFVQYDSRDVVTEPHRGIYLRFEQQFFPRWLGNESTFYRGELFFDYYHKVWRGGILATDLHMQFNTVGVPWTMLAELGGPYRMRGYYQGRFRDRGILEAQVELRQKIHGRNGVAVWVGAGNIFPTFGEITLAHTLPDFGIGYRWEFKKRVNVRIDYGVGKNWQRGFVVNINEAF